MESTGRSCTFLQFNPGALPELPKNLCALKKIHYHFSPQDLGMTTSVKQKILRNSAWNIIAKVFYFPANLLLIPFIVGKLGAEQYGLWVILFAFVDYFGLLDLGVGAATIKFAAEYRAEENGPKLGRLITTASVFNLIFLPPIAAAFLFADSILELLRIASSDTGQAVLVFRWVLIIFVIGQFTAVFRNLMIGLQLIHICNICEIVYFLSYATGTVLVLSGGGGIKELVVILFILRCGLAASQAFFAIRTVPEMFGGIRSYDARMFKDFMRYGFKLQMTSLAGLLNFQFDKLLIGFFLRMEFVAFYDLGSKLASVVRLIPSFLMSPLIPAAAELAAQRDTSRLKELYWQGTRFMALIAAPAAGFLVANAASIITLWLAEHAHASATMALQVLSIAYFFNIVTGALNSIGRGMGVLRYEIEATSILSLLNVVLSSILILKFGFAGVLIGTCLAMTTGNLFYLIRFTSFMGCPFIVFFLQVLAKPVGCAIAAGLFSHYAGTSLFGSAEMLSRTQALLNLIVSGGVFAAVFVCGLLIAGGVARSDALLVREVISAVRSM